MITLQNGSTTLQPVGVRSSVAPKRRKSSERRFETSSNVMKTFLSSGKRLINVEKHCENPSVCALRCRKDQKVGRGYFGNVSVSEKRHFPSTKTLFCVSKQ